MLFIKSILKTNCWVYNFLPFYSHFIYFFIAVLVLQQNTDFSYTPWHHIYIYNLLYLINLSLHSGTFVIIDDPTLMHHNHPKFIVYIMFHSWCLFYRFGQIYDGICPSLWHHAEYFYCPLTPKSSVLYLFLSLTPPNPRNHWTSYCLHSFAFLGCHIVGIII